MSAVLLAFIVVGILVGRPGWGELAPLWPGGGYGFAVTVGVLLPCWAAGAALAMTKAASHWRTERSHALAWAASGTVGVAGTVVSCMLALIAYPPKSRYAAQSMDVGESGWVNEQWPGAWVVGMGTTVLCAAVLAGIAWHLGRRKPRPGKKAAGRRS